MRKLILLSAAVAMTMAPMPIQADPQPNPGDDQGRNAELLAFCEYQMTLDSSLTLGTCMSYFVSGDEGYLTQFCRYLQDHDQLGGLTFSECVREIRQD